MVLTFFCSGKINIQLSKSRKEKIEKLASSILDRWSMFLVDVEIQGGSETNIWIYVDSEDRDVGLDECAEVSQELGFLIDAHEVINTNHRLNVSTPGLDQPLKDPRQYKKNEGRKARVRFRGENDSKTIEGRMEEVEDERVKIRKPNDEHVVVEFTDIIETVIVPEINK